MTAQEAVAYIETYTWSSTRLGLERTCELLERVGNPQKKLKFVHVAGSNGKGSICAMLSSVLRAAGYRVGLYVSPHLQAFQERFQIDGAPVSEAVFAAAAERVREAAEAMDDHPSQFELSTAVGMLCYQEAGCELVVLEVGLGGALDSTNAIDAPEAAVIANIGLEHTEYLGNTLEEIASAKAGIIKPGCDCVCYDGPPEAMGVIRETCRKQGVPLHTADFSRLQPLSHGLDGQEFLWKGKTLRIPLLGGHQRNNCAVVLETLSVLRDRGWRIGEEAVRAGLARTVWPARMEVLGRDPLFLLDGGHNPQCVQALTEALREYLPGQRVTFLTGVLADKDYRTMLHLAKPLARRFVCVTPENGRAMPAGELAEQLKDEGCAAVACGDIPQGIQAALAYGDGPVVAFGSLYMAGAIREAFPGIYRSWVRRRGIQARESLSPEEREALSQRAAETLSALPELQRAETVLLYRAIHGEVRLEALEKYLKSQGKRVAYPLCVSGTEMTARLPHGEDAWTEGRYGIPEPLRERSEEIPPEELDLVVCPCTAFDEACRRMGMGAGFYDRYLKGCVNAAVIAVAFECQKNAQLPAAPWDRPMDLIATENGVYRRKAGKNA